jgi:hypothetical protein
MGSVAGTTVTIARLITQASLRRIVRYRDGDRLNLRRDNLHFDAGWAKDRERKIISALSLAVLVPATVALPMRPDRVATCYAMEQFARLKELEALRVPNDLD